MARIRPSRRPRRPTRCTHPHTRLRPPEKSSTSVIPERYRSPPQRSTPSYAISRASTRWFRCSPFTYHPLLQRRLDLGRGAKTWSISLMSAAHGSNPGISPWGTPSPSIRRRVPSISRTSMGPSRGAGRGQPSYVLPPYIFFNSNPPSDWRISRIIGAVYQRIPTLAEGARGAGDHGHVL